MTASDLVIRVENLGKKYALHHQPPQRYRALRDSISQRAKATTRLLNPFTLAAQLQQVQRQVSCQQQAAVEEFWALKDVNFEIQRGERVGIIGRNGGGKSTLLKILSRIVEPTTGRVEIRGRVASLLEVGTGFHPELTGRENIYLNGAILGMSRREIQLKFDEIVAFAEMEKFLDTPVKHYSSGMYVRLAFAVAAHLEPEILVVDEVLAVGDAVFQKRCIGKMWMAAEDDGKTILVVSHSIAIIQSICNRILLCQQGRAQWHQDVGTGIAAYQQSCDLGPRYSRSSLPQAQTAGQSTLIRNLWLEDRRGQPAEHFAIGDPMRICLELCLGPASCSGSRQRLIPGFGINDAAGQRIATLNGFLLKPTRSDPVHPQIMTAKLSIESLPLVPGIYCLDVSLADSPTSMIASFPDCIRFRIDESNYFQSGFLPGPGQGPLLIRAQLSLA